MEKTAQRPFLFGWEVSGEAGSHIDLTLFARLEHLRQCEKCRKELPFELFVRLLQEIYGRQEGE